MYCSKCGYLVSDDMLFCPQCGKQLKEIKKVCYYCHLPLADNEDICPACNRKQEVIEEDIYKGYWRKPIIWIITLTLLLASFMLGNYMTSHPLNLSKTESYNLSGNVSLNDLNGNNQANSTVIKDSNYLYYVLSNKLYRAKLSDITNSEVLIEDCVGYLSLQDKLLYYCDSKYNYYSFDLSDNSSDLLLENIYYPIIYQDNIYYQLDSDHESIYCFNLKNKDNKKLNDETSYSLAITKEYLYYLTKDTSYTLKRMSLVNNKVEELYQGQCDFYLDDKYLYISDGNKIIKKDQETLEETLIKEVKHRAMILINNNIIYASDLELNKLDLSNNKEEVLYNKVVISSLQKLGNDLFMEVYGQNGESFCIFNLDGKYYELNTNTHTNFENVQDV